jgi:hypothetical protein
MIAAEIAKMAIQVNVLNSNIILFYLHQHGLLLDHLLDLGLILFLYQLPFLCLVPDLPLFPDWE